MGLVIDLGCGTGLSCAPLHLSGREVIGVDPSPAMLARAVGHSRITSPWQSDAAATGLPDHSADTVITSNLLHIHPDPRQVLDEAWRLVAPGGLLVVVWPSAGATLVTAFLADIQSRRPFGRGVLASALRLGVGLVGAPFRARRRAGETVASLLAQWVSEVEVRPIDAGSIFGVQDYATYAKASRR